jgi:dephospho-CoA kinase
VVFGNPAQLAVLNGIVHPLVREAAAGILGTAADGAVVVQDIPLLVETGQGSDFHLVIVVDAPDDVRVNRMLEHRGMTADDARSRMAAQATRGDRLAAADVVLDNSASIDGLLAQVDALWAERLAPFARNLATKVPAERPGGPVLNAPQADWPRDAERLMARIRAAVAKNSGPEGAEVVLGLDHIGSTSVPGLDAKDVLDLQLTVRNLAAAAPLEEVLAAAGYPRVPAITADAPKPTRPDPAAWAKRFHASADPGRAVNLHVRASGSPGWRFALCFRDWLRAEPDAAADYLALKRRLAALHAADPSTAAYAAAKEAWFAAVEGPMERWAERAGWVPPSYAS